MKRLILLPAALLAALAAGCGMANSPHRAAASWPSIADNATQTMAMLTVRVTDLRNHEGQMLFAVFKSPEGFPKEKARSVAWQAKPATADTIVFTVALPPGKYAASALHDENKNNKMDMNFLGIPEEGYGVTNNPKPDYRQARFDEAVFDLPPGGATLTISMQYF